jgi:hypothetical protein
MKKEITGVVLLFTLSACSSIIEGTSQEIMVNTNPAGAECSLMRQGNSIARIDPTPGAATIKKTKYDITIVCNKEGYQEATYLNHSGAAGATFGNIVAGGGIGWAIDSASGADNKYDSSVNITLVPEEEESDESAQPKKKAKKHRAPPPEAATAEETSEEGDKDRTDHDAKKWPSEK